MPLKAKINLLQKIKQKFLRDGVEHSSNVHLGNHFFHVKASIANSDVKVATMNAAGFKKALWAGEIRLFNFGLAGERESWRSA